MLLDLLQEKKRKILAAIDRQRQSSSNSKSNSYLPLRSLHGDSRSPAIQPQKSGNRVNGQSKNFI